MKKLGTKGIKVLKTSHLLFVMIWVVGVLAMAVIGLIKPRSGDELYMALYITRLIDDVFVIPGAVCTVLSAAVYGLCTNWGFFKYRWITVKWIVSILIIVVGTFYFSPKLDRCLEIVRLTQDAALNNPELISNLHITAAGAFIQSGALIFLVIISVFKPWKKKKNI